MYFILFVCAFILTIINHVENVEGRVRYYRKKPVHRHYDDYYNENYDNYDGNYDNYNRNYENYNENYYSYEDYGNKENPSDERDPPPTTTPAPVAVVPETKKPEIITTPKPTAKPKPPRWRCVGKKEYKVVYNRTTWHYAWADCRRKGGNLATVRSQNEQDALEAAIRNTPTDIKGIFWLAGNDINNEGSYGWRVDDCDEPSCQDPFTYTKWRQGQPDNSEGGEHCLEIDRPQENLWNDRPCSNTFDYVCERCE